jgi:hypothetical protein
LKVRPQFKVIEGGLQLASDFMVQGDLRTIPLTTAAGYQGFMSKTCPVQTAAPNVYCPIGCQGRSPGGSEPTGPRVRPLERPDRRGPTHGPRVDGDTSAVMPACPGWTSDLVHGRPLSRRQHKVAASAGDSQRSQSNLTSDASKERRPRAPPPTPHRRRTLMVRRSVIRNRTDN